MANDLKLLNSVSSALLKLRDKACIDKQLSEEYVYLAKCLEIAENNSLLIEFVYSLIHTSMNKDVMGKCKEALREWDLPYPE